MVPVSIWCILLISGFVLANDQCSLLCSSGVCCDGANGHQQCCPVPDVDFSSNSLFIFHRVSAVNPAPLAVREALFAIPMVIAQEFSLGSLVL